MLEMVIDIPNHHASEVGNCKPYPLHHWNICSNIVTFGVHFPNFGDGPDNQKYKKPDLSIRLFSSIPRAYRYR